jgi:iron complex transport system permease protein
MSQAVAGRPTGRLRPAWMLAALALLVVASVASAVVGPASIEPWDAVQVIVGHLPFVDLDAGLSERQLDILRVVRFPRVALGAVVGATLALAGGAYQGVFRNPLADPFLLGVAAGAGLGATFAIVAGGGSVGPFQLLPAAAFVGAVGGVLLTYGLGRSVGDRTASTLILAGVAVAAFLTAAQTYLQQQNTDDLRVVYAWLFGRLTTTGWREVALVLPYTVVAAVVILLHRRLLDVLSVGDGEAAALGIAVGRVRIIVVIAATLGTAAAVAVSGLIGFVGIIVPHAVRLLVGSSYRIVLPLAAVLGAAFLVGADLAARTMISPAELPIGVVTAFIGAPFFVVVLRTSRRAL